MNGKGDRPRIANYAKYWENVEAIDFALEVKCEHCGHVCKSKAAVPRCSKCRKPVFAPRKKGQRMAGMRFGKINGGG